RDPVSSRQGCSDWPQANRGAVLVSPEYWYMLPVSILIATIAMASGVERATFFTVPGVIIGGQIGSLVAARIPQRVLEISLGMLFVLVAGLTLGQVVL
ncbi:MAG TPA: hypothetical protein VE136_11705, partial [Anaerolineales bacterium]|nr:hypothetical protein [Anaerolineales bacterium]